MGFNNIVEKEIRIGDIPTIVLTPNNDFKIHPTIIFYHGWGSNIDKQRFRGFILCSLGYQVLIPCAIFHGDREPVDHSNPENAREYFWNVILKNIEESSLIIDYAVDSLQADSSRIGVCGHSMGGFTASGVFTLNRNLNALVVFNGSCNWAHSNKLFMEGLNISDSDLYNELQESVDKYNPMKNLEYIIDRPILLLHGDNDTLVSIDAQREFYKEVAVLYHDSERISFIEYPKLNHFVTTNMMEQAYDWFNRYL